MLGKKSYEIVHKYSMNKTSYDIFDNIYKKELCEQPDNMLYFFIWGEYYTYDIEKEDQNNKNIYWVSRYYGDGFGFDVLTFDKSTQKEKLIEVKTGHYDDFVLTNNEYSVMEESSKHNADYYIYKYTYNKNDNMIYIKKFKHVNNGIVIFDEEKYDFYSYMDNREYTPKKIYKIKKIDM